MSEFVVVQSHRVIYECWKNIDSVIDFKKVSKLLSQSILRLLPSIHIKLFEGWFSTYLILQMI